jgi:hypothetical protein
VKRELQILTVCLAVALLILGVMFIPGDSTRSVDAQGGTPTPDQFASNIFMWDGGNRMFVASGGQIVVQSGGEIEFESGGTLDVDGTIDTTGGTLSIGSATASGTLAVTGMTTHTGGETTVVNVENIGQPTWLSVPITWTAAAGGTGTVATIGAGEVWVIHDVLIETTTNFDCTGDDVTLVVGDGNTAAGFLDLADADLQAAVTEGTGFSAGWIGQDDDNAGVYLDETEYGFVYDEASAETIDWLLDETSGETITAGAATIYVFYTRIQ